VGLAVTGHSPRSSPKLLAVLSLSLSLSNRPHGFVIGHKKSCVALPVAVMGNLKGVDAYVTGGSRASTPSGKVLYECWRGRLHERYVQFKHGCLRRQPSLQVPSSVIGHSGVLFGRVEK
jgi:hypothetical protein